MMLFPRAYSCLIILETIGSTFYRIVLRRNFDKTVYYKYYLQYLIFSAPVVSYVGWYYYWKVEPLMSKFNIEINFIL